MSRAPDRRPSTLAAGRAIAATRPFPAVPAASRPAAPPVSSLAPKSASGTLLKPALATASRTAPTTATTTAPRAAHAESGEKRVMLTVVVLFLVCAVALASVGVAGSVRQGRSREAMAITFTKLHAQQQNFRLLNARFATWSELEAAGAMLQPRQRLVASNADASHWFLSLSDTEAGVVCDRTGELFDESSDEREPVCRTVGP